MWEWLPATNIWSFDCLEAYNTNIYISAPRFGVSSLPSCCNHRSGSSISLLFIKGSSLVCVGSPKILWLPAFYPVTIKLKRLRLKKRPDYMFPDEYSLVIIAKITTIGHCEETKSTKQSPGKTNNITTIVEEIAALRSQWPFLTMSGNDTSTYSQPPR